MLYHRVVLPVGSIDLFISSNQISKRIALNKNLMCLGIAFGGGGGHFWNSYAWVVCQWWQVTLLRGSGPGHCHAFANDKEMPVS